MSNKPNKKRSQARGSRTKIEQIKQDIARHGFRYVKIEMEGTTGRDRVFNGYDALDYYLSKLPRELKVIYSNIYYDGGDTEITITFPLAQLELAPKVIKAFADLSQRCQGELPYVESAGLHCSVMTSESYPVAESPFTDSQLANFTTQLNKLKAGLVVLAAHSVETRRFGSRPFRVMRGNKYSLVNMRGTCFEYRVFDTCYHDPKRIIDNYGVIANTLKYLDPSVKYKGEEAKMREDLPYSWVPVADLFPNKELLEEQVDALRPKWTTVTKIKERTKFAD